jgi:hypothetical protein
MRTFHIVNETSIRDSSWMAAAALRIPYAGFVHPDRRTLSAGMGTEAKDAEKPFFTRLGCRSTMPWTSSLSSSDEAASLAQTT